MVLYFLRHASAGQYLADVKKDEKRSLDSEGSIQCGYIGRALAALDVHPDLVISSPLKRAVQTASLVANELGYEGKIQIDAALRPESTFDDFLQMLKTIANAENVMVVGHNHSLSEFLGQMIGGKSNPAQAELKKGAVARVDVRRSSGSLMWSFTPKVARALLKG